MTTGGSEGEEREKKKDSTLAHGAATAKNVTKKGRKEERKEERKKERERNSQKLSSITFI